MPAKTTKTTKKVVKKYKSVSDLIGTDLTQKEVVEQLTVLQPTVKRKRM